MDINQLPASFLHHQHFQLIAPDMAWVEEMRLTLNDFDAAHHEFLLWSPGIHSPESVRENMRIAIHNFQQNQEEYKFLIISNDNGGLLGCISLFIRNARIPSYEIGYWLATKAMGKGIMHQACKMVTHIACDFFRAKRVEIRVAGRNQRSQAVAVKCGFKLEAMLRNERTDSLGHTDDTLIYCYCTADKMQNA
ncbi:RimJ/RimL family protein N-acetyltransferase [Erwinia toletana]|uniref:RimJ/RimL family protein N-acetyltransferase n=1 Tax=Winslowiella toletana TaxID=92490 RepID=A0ABS4PFB0_9GAMM|nr:GNAT family N-acetyltransferase [Winslowiella toletana]MBP2170827.1 RimJ/RimL family protein N-acetyltransferase [Winslowiella toletana]